LITVVIASDSNHTEGDNLVLEDPLVRMVEMVQMALKAIRAIKEIREILGQQDLLTIFKARYPPLNC
jgi:hypothetical protein